MECYQWWGRPHLKHALQGSKIAVLHTSCHPKCSPVTIAHLTALRNSLNLSNTFNAAVFGMAAVTFWCQCHLAKVCMDLHFDPLIHASCTSPQKSGTMASNISYSSFWPHPRKPTLQAKRLDGQTQPACVVPSGHSRTTC